MKPREWWVPKEDVDRVIASPRSNVYSRLSDRCDESVRSYWVEMVDKSAYDEALALIKSMKIRWQTLAMCAVSPDGITYKDAIEMADKALAEIEKLHVGGSDS